MALLAIDAGGSTTRASLVDATGRCLGHGRDLGGNPASNMPERAAAAIVSATEAAVADAGAVPIDLALIALAGPLVHVAQGRIEQAFRTFGLTGPLVFTGDLHALLASVTAREDGYCIVTGTGAGAARIRAGAIERVVDAAGWLLGDFGSGYWLGHQAAIAATAELDGRGERTALTPAILDMLGIRPGEAPSRDSRLASLRLLIDAIYAMRPIELARFAPLVIAHRDDPVAARLLGEAEDYLLADFTTVFDPLLPGPVALGGGIVSHLRNLPGAVADVIRAAGHSPEIHLVGDGSVGAIVLALRASGHTVDDAMLQAIAASVAARQGKQAMAV